jgi:hypothetical protein
MTTIQKTVAVPIDGRLHLDLDLPPANFPSLADIMVRIRPQTAKPSAETAEKADDYDTFDKFYGCLKDTDVFKGDSVEIVRKMRDEW